VWATRNQFNVAASAYEPLFEHWNGQRWSMVTGPVTGVPSRISAAGGSEVWAIGERDATSPAGLPVVRPIIYHFDGTRWRVQATPALTAEYGYGDVGIEAVSASDVWAFVLHGVRGGATPTGPDTPAMTGSCAAGARASISTGMSPIPPARALRSPPRPRPAPLAVTDAGRRAALPPRRLSDLRHRRLRTPATAAPSAPPPRFPARTRRARPRESDLLTFSRNGPGS
jgi:hypothetical protein